MSDAGRIDLAARRSLGGSANEACARGFDWPRGGPGLCFDAPVVLGRQARGGDGTWTNGGRLGALAILSWCLLGACGSSDSQSSRSVVADGPVAYRILAEESQVQGKAALGIAINEADYRALWEQAGFAEDRPPVDFGVQAVVIVTSSYGSGCEPLFGRLRIENAEIQVQSVGLEPGQTCAADENVHGLGLAINRAILTEGPYLVRAGSSVAELSLG